MAALRARHLAFHMLVTVSTPDPEGPVHLEPVHVRAPTATPDPDGPVHLESVHVRAPGGKARTS